jgi:hypothetical protein
MLTLPARYTPGLADYPSPNPTHLMPPYSATQSSFLSTTDSDLFSSMPNMLDNKYAEGRWDTEDDMFGQQVMGGGGGGIGEAPMHSAVSIHNTCNWLSAYR